MNYGRPCEYLGICSGHDSADSDRWTKKTQLHDEISIEFEDRGVSVLTHSRIRTFMTCPRKHYLRYVLGIERADDETAEALRFGTLFHQAREVWINPPKEVAVNDSNSNGNSPSAGDCAASANAE